MATGWVPDSVTGLDRCSEPDSDRYWAEDSDHCLVQDWVPHLGMGSVQSWVKDLVQS